MVSGPLCPSLKGLAASQHPHTRVHASAPEPVEEQATLQNSRWGVRVNETGTCFSPEIKGQGSRCQSQNLRSKMVVLGKPDGPMWSV